MNNTNRRIEPQMEEIPLHNIADIIYQNELAKNIEKNMYLAVVRLT